MNDLTDEEREHLATIADEVIAARLDDDDLTSAIGDAAHAVVDALYAEILNMVAEEIKRDERTDWGVQYGPGGARGVNQFPDRESCERFIKFPPLWASSNHLLNPVIVSRRASSAWTPAPTTPEGQNNG